MGRERDVFCTKNNDFLSRKIIVSSWRVKYGFEENLEHDEEDSLSAPAYDLRLGFLLDLQVYRLDGPSSD